VARGRNPPADALRAKAKEKEIAVDAPAKELRALKRTPHTPVTLLALLMVMAGIGPLALNILIPAVPGLVRTLNTDVETVQLTVSLFLFGLAAAQLALGPLSDRFGRRPVVLGGLALMVVASAVSIAASSIGALIAARVIQALGASTGVVIGRAILRDLYERDRAAAMLGWVTTAMVMAPMIAPLIGGLLDTAFGWQSIFVFVTLASVGVLAWAWAALPETRPHHVTGGGLRHLWQDARALLTDASFNGYVLVSAFGTASFFAFLGGGPHVAIGLMGLTSAEFGVWFMINGLGYMAGNFAAARFSQHYGVFAMIRAGLAFELLGAIFALAGALMFANVGPAGLFIPQFFLSLGNGLLLPNAIAGAVSVRPQAAGTASGITGFAQMGLGALAAQAMSHVLSSASSAAPLALALFLLVIATAVSYFALLRKRGRR
jgi:DHA1 family bicyclomycin/chloramphenicol resistance-like MFS transporter